ncbi:glucan endo-1,3-beta-glucosidase-like [Abrus precatorius]|uniref:Glucan endo-1,3-beta-glucosidase-like n=1 Tax=Abrus precatorius TaxID=3816 RepID=A0A8B8L1A5_ABRPR|nr:glucan endo-1,3-beta-glucosidase-like [Abrus precatorius]
MFKSTGSLLFLVLFHLLLSFNSGGHLKFANGLIAKDKWCVANPLSNDTVLKNNIEYACNILSDCKLIQPGGSCYEPNKLMHHASAVMNQYYAMEGRNTWNCNFFGSGLLVSKDPSYGSCEYA